MPTGVRSVRLEPLFQSSQVEDIFFLRSFSYACNDYKRYIFFFSLP
jgi:hypothetical protein